MKNILFTLCCLMMMAISAPRGIAQKPDLEKISLPPGFQIHLYAANVPDARSMSAGPPGTVFVGTRKTGNVYAVMDEDGDFKADKIVVIRRGLTMPNGVAFKDGHLYVAEMSRVTRYRNIMQHLNAPGEPEIVNDTFPEKRWHGWKFIRFGPDGKLYIPVGAPCNVCEKADRRFAAILKMDPDGGNLSVFARGVRNTVGFDWHPVTGELWFTDNGRDWLGDDLPPDELNHAPKIGLHFGYPYFYGDNIPDPKFGTQSPKGKFTPPARELGPHVAPLGMRFYTGQMFPEAYRNRIFIAEHGSWNRSVPIGYRITLVRLENDRAVNYEIFAEGWLQGDEVSGRPVDLEILHDGSMLVSDDHAGMIYRIVYSP